MTIAIGFLPLAPPAARQAAGLPPLKACSAYVIVFPCGIFKSSAHIRRWNSVAFNFLKSSGSEKLVRFPLKYSRSCVIVFFIIFFERGDSRVEKLWERTRLVEKLTFNKCLSSQTIFIGPKGDGMIVLYIIKLPLNHLQYLIPNPLNSPFASSL